MTSPETKDFFKSVMADVINSMTSIFNEEGMDDAVLLDLKQIWEEKYDSIRPGCDITVKQTKPFIVNPAVILNQSVFSNFQQSNTRAVSHISINQLNNIRQSANQLPRLTLVNNNQIILRNPSMPLIRLGNMNVTNNANNVIRSQLIKHIKQLDGNDDSSSDDNLDIEDDAANDIDEDDDDQIDIDDDDDDDGANEEELNSGDDLSIPDPNEIFDCDNLILCQYNKVSRNKNIWNFNLKCGVMNIKSRDFIFGAASGISDW